MEKQIVKINEDQLREVLKVEIEKAHKFEWTGWRIPIYVEDDGSVSSGEWLSNNSWQPDAIELPMKIETWSMNDCGFEGDFTDKEEMEDGEEGWNRNDMDYIIDESIDFRIERLKEDENNQYEWELI